MSKPKSNRQIVLPKVVNSQIIFEESIFKIRRDQLQLPDQPLYPYYTLVTKPSAVVILAKREDGLYLLTQEYRHPVGKVLLSCPGGYIDDQEQPLAAAARELQEETGYTAASFTLLGQAYPYAGVSMQKTYYVLATNAKHTGNPRLEPSELIQTTVLSKENLMLAIKQGADLDSNLTTALFFESQIV